MPSRKPARRPKVRPARTQTSRRSVPADPRCNLPNICRYLQNLSDWLGQLDADYTALRIAVCNVEKQAFSNTGVNATPPRFCGDSGNEPAPPVPFGYG